MADLSGAHLSISLSLADPQQPYPFGTDRVFAWRLLAQWQGIEPAHERSAVRAEAALHVRLVTWDVTTGRLTKVRPNHIEVATTDWERSEDGETADPTVLYDIEVYDPSLLSGLSPFDERELVVLVDEWASPLENDASPRPPPVVQELPWVRLSYADGTTWAARPAPGGYELVVQAPGEPPLNRRREGRPEELERLIEELLSTGWRRD
ncbi:MAG: hypothetical protein ACOZQL_17980 [Myxococcota bacterium]